MAEQRPIIIGPDGELTELPEGDTLPGGGGTVATGTGGIIDGGDRTDTGATIDGGERV